MLPSCCRVERVITLCIFLGTVRIDDGCWKCDNAGDSRWRGGREDGKDC